MQTFEGRRPHQLLEGRQRRLFGLGLEKGVDAGLQRTNLALVLADVGADAVAVSAFPGSAKEEETLRTLAQVVGEAHAAGQDIFGYEPNGEMAQAFAAVVAEALKN